VYHVHISLDSEKRTYGAAPEEDGDGVGGGGGDGEGYNYIEH
jgi:hypothetical protein